MKQIIAIKSTNGGKKNGAGGGAIAIHPVETEPKERTIVDMTYGELLEYRQKMNHEMEVLQAGISVINGELLDRLRAEKLTGKIVGKWGISKTTRWSFATSLDEAKALGAVKEAVNSEKLKQLVLTGVEVPGSKKTEYVTVREVEASK